MVAVELPVEDSLLGRVYLADSLQLLPQLLPDNDCTWWWWWGTRAGPSPPSRGFSNSQSFLRGPHPRWPSQCFLNATRQPEAPSAQASSSLSPVPGVQPPLQPETLLSTLCSLSALFLTRSSPINPLQASCLEVCFLEDLNRCSITVRL